MDTTPQILFKERPTQEQIARYESKLKHFLQNQHVNVAVILRDKPIKIESFVNNAHTETQYNWIDRFEVITPEISFKANNPFREGISSETLTDGEI